MPNDARLGLAAGVALVIAVAVMYFRKESTAAPPQAATNTRPEVDRPPQASPRSARKLTPATSTSWIGNAPTATAVRRHTVQPGDTFQSVARHYYGSEDMEAVLAAANRDAMVDGELVTGTVLVIPTMPEEP